MAKSQAGTVPAGFHLQSGTTVVSGTEYPVEYLQADSVDAIRNHYESEGHDVNTVMLGIWNSAQRQGALQGPKQAIRSAQTAEDGDVDAEVVKAQEATRGYIIGAPRASGGMTKKTLLGMGEKVARRFAEKHGRPPTEEELDKVLDDLI